MLFQHTQHTEPGVSVVAESFFLYLWFFLGTGSRRIQCWHMLSLQESPSHAIRLQVFKDTLWNGKENKVTDILLSTWFQIHKWLSSYTPKCPQSARLCWSHLFLVELILWFNSFFFFNCHECINAKEKTTFSSWISAKKLIRKGGICHTQVGTYLSKCYFCSEILLRL